MSNNTSKLLNKSKKHLEIEYFRIIEDTNLKNKNVHGLDKARREIGIIPIEIYIRIKPPYPKSSANNKRLAQKIIIPIKMDKIKIPK